MRAGRRRELVRQSGRYQGRRVLGGYSALALGWDGVLPRDKVAPGAATAVQRVFDVMATNACCPAVYASSSLLKPISLRLKTT